MDNDDFVYCTLCYGTGKRRNLNDSRCSPCDGTGYVTPLQAIQIDNLMGAKIRASYMLTLKMATDICGPYDSRILIYKGWDKRIVDPDIEYIDIRGYNIPSPE